jgi:NADH:ubiquinone oxidoreductase subunit H
MHRVFVGITKFVVQNWSIRYGSCGFILQYLQKFYAQILMYLIIHLCFYIGFIDVYEVPEDDRDRSKHVGVTTNCSTQKI